MKEKSREKSVLVIPCSGIGKVQGLISREATYIATEELAPGKTETICLALLVKGDAEAVDAVSSMDCIAIDGCSKACAQKNIQIAGGRTARAIQITEFLKNHKGVKCGTPTELTGDGWTIAREIGAVAADTALRLLGDEWELQ